jgi:thioredoxin 2
MTSVAKSAVLPCTICGTLNRVDIARAMSTATGATCGTCKTALPLDVPLVLTEATFDAVVHKSTVPVLVDFYADWCGPCQMMAPVFADFARRERGQVIVAKVDTDANPTLSARFGIRSIPTLTLMHGGREVSRQVGAVPLAALERMVSGLR